MQAALAFWTLLGVAGQAVVIGALASAVVALAQRWWPGLVLVPNQVKRVLIAAGVGLSAYALTGDIGAAIAAALSAFGTYQLATGRSD